MKTISVSNLSFSYSKNQNIIDDVSFDIEEGKYVSIVGPNGSGKSTLARLIVGLLDKTNGSISLFGQEVDKKNIVSLRKDIGIVFQNPDNQFIGATVEDDIAFGLENKLTRKEEMRDIVQNIANSLGVSPFLTKEPSNLSGGQKQRVALAGVLALSPKLLILDEATSMLDPKGKKEIFELIKEIKKNNPSLTIVSITHDVEEAYLSDQVIVIVDGKVAFNDVPSKIFSNEEKLKEYHLRTPFIYQVMNAFNPLGFDIKDTDSLEEVAKKLCR